MPPVYPGGGFALRQPSILIIDDDDETGARIRRVLRQAGFDANFHAGSLGALTAIREASCDVVLLDVHMPRLDGLAVMRMIRGSLGNSRLRVVLYSNMETSVLGRLAASIGAHDAVSKQASDSELVAKIKDALDRRGHTAPPSTPRKSDRFLLSDLFASESEGLLASMTACLEALRTNPSDAGAIAKLVTDAHALRGVALVAGRDAVADRAGQLEHTLEPMKSRAEEATADRLAILAIHVDMLRVLGGRPVHSSDVSARAAERGEPRDGAAAEEPRTILAVDDSPTTIHYVQRALGRAGFRVLAACSEAAAVEVLAKVTPALILLDLSVVSRRPLESMLEGFGHGAPAAAPIVLFSNRPEDELRDIATRAGAAGFICKSCDLTTLPARLGEWLGGARVEAGAR
jgi:DNA-binding response OmpR family regulator